MAAQNFFGLTTRLILHSECILQNPFSQNSIFGLTSAPQTLRNSWLGSNKLHSADFRPISPKLRPTAATIAFSLPTTTPVRVSSDSKIPKWSSRAIKAYAMSELEARKIRKPNTGTEALLMGILIEGTNTAAKFLRANGITLEKVREETFNLLGKPNKYFFSPEHPPLTEAAQRVIDRAFAEKLNSGEGGEVTTTDLLLSIWAETDSPGQKILAICGFSDEKAKELKSLSSESAFKPSP
uniref:Clp R domain-containing protein n=1 Tax=Kalanchoe fedtschenkoi TaxID=63787 RepID=A0A7N0SYY9_KALFE